jgi:hypothetical protein
LLTYGNIANAGQRFHSSIKLFERGRPLLGFGVLRPAQRNIQRQHAFRIETRVGLQSAAKNY